MFVVQFFFRSIALGLVFLPISVAGFSDSVKTLSNPEKSHRVAQFTTSTPSIELAIEQAVHDRINQYRATLGLPPLSLDERITREARVHSQNMASGKVVLGHEGFSRRVQAIAIPYRAAAENVAYNRGYSDPDARAVEGWLSSFGHLRNIQGNYNLTGVGVVKNAHGAYYFTQIFVLSR